MMLNNYKMDKMNELNRIHFVSIYIFDNEYQVWMVKFYVHYLMDISLIHSKHKTELKYTVYLVFNYYIGN